MLEGYAMTLAYYKDWASKNIDPKKIKKDQISMMSSSLEGLERWPWLVKGLFLLY